MDDSIDALEKAVSKLLADFEQKTGKKIESIHLEEFDATTFGSRVKTRLTQVRVFVEEPKPVRTWNI